MTKNKRKRKHTYRILSFFLFAFLFGFIFTLLVYQGIWANMLAGFSRVPIWAYPLWLIFSFYLTLSLHELGHFFAFIVQGVKTRAIYITIFIFYKTEKGWKFSVNPKLWVLFGGLVVPDLGEIKTEEDYQKTVNAFAKSLIIGPIVTISTLILTWLVTISFLIWSQNVLWIGILMVNTIFITLLSMLYIYTFKLSNPMFYGDFIAHQKMKDDPIFQVVQINQYTMFSLDEHQETNRFLFQKTKALLLSTDINQSLFHTMLLTVYLEGVIHMDYEMDPIIHEKIRKISVVPYLRTEQGFMLANAIVYYHYVTKDINLAYAILNQIYQRSYPKLDQKLIEYMKKKSYHLLHIENYESFLSDKENIYLGMSWLFDRLIDPFEDLQEQHKPLPYTPYVCEVDLSEPLLDEQKSD